MKSLLFSQYVQCTSIVLTTIIILPHHHCCRGSYQGGVQVMCVRSLLPPPEEKIFLISLSLAGLALHNAHIPGGENLYNCLLLGRNQVGVSIKVWCHSQKRTCPDGN